jgi:hypothetical protein
MYWHAIRDQVAIFSVSTCRVIYFILFKLTNQARGNYYLFKNETWNLGDVANTVVESLLLGSGSHDRGLERIWRCKSRSTILEEIRAPLNSSAKLKKQYYANGIYR